MAQTGALGDKIFKSVLLVAAATILLIVAAIVVMMVLNSIPTLERFGFRFLIGREWNPSQAQFGALPFIYGTVVSSLIALILAVPVSLGIAVFLVEQAPKGIARPIAFLVELLAAIPSVVYGLWGIFVLAPFIRNYLGAVLQDYLGWLPLFEGRLTGIGMLMAVFNSRRDDHTDHYGRCSRCSRSRADDSTQKPRSLSARQSGKQPRSC